MESEMERSYLKCDAYNLLSNWGVPGYIKIFCTKTVCTIVNLKSIDQTTWLLQKKIFPSIVFGQIPLFEIMSLPDSVSVGCFIDIMMDVTRHWFCLQILRGILFPPEM